MKTVDSLKLIVERWPRLLALLLFFSLHSSLFVCEAQAQDENAAFYIYQNDGHFDGFFYDEVQKISYSFLDTLGIEHPEVVSQEIVTADSTYRIMLSAIDSVGFVQPEVKCNPCLHRVRISGENKYSYSDESTGNWSVSFTFNNDDLTITYDLMNKTPEKWPKEGDVFMFPGTSKLSYSDGWAVKVESVEEQNYYTVLHCEPIDEITDIFHQFVTVEEYGYKPDGSLARRRVAGCPELTQGVFPNKANIKQWQGDIFNFSLGGHITLYSKDDLVISVDPSFEGHLNIKATWNLSLFGDKYIGITSTLGFAVGMGLSVDGKISDFFPGGIGGLVGGVPIPATCPLIMLDIAPDAFLRGEAHVKFNV